MPFIRMRNLPIAIASTLFLHLYLLKICIAYTTNGHFTCSAEFWIMSIYLPFGIALFQANVTQLRSISERQEKLLTRQLSFNRTLALPSRGQIRHLTSRWRELSYAQKSYIFIACGMVVQFSLQESCTAPRRLYKVTGRAMASCRSTRDKVCVANHCNGFRVPSGSFSGHGSTDRMSCSRSETSTMLTVGGCRQSCASSQGKYRLLCTSLI